MYHRALLSPTIEFSNLLLREVNNAIDLRMNRVIPATVGILPCAELRTLLADDNAPGTHLLPSKELYAMALASTIPSIRGRATGFLMCHSGSMEERNAEFKQKIRHAERSEPQSGKRSRSISLSKESMTRDMLRLHTTDPGRIRSIPLSMT